MLVREFHVISDAHHLELRDLRLFKFIGIFFFVSLKSVFRENVSRKVKILLDRLAKSWEISKRSKFISSGWSERKLKSV